MLYTNYLLYVRITFGLGWASVGLAFSLSLFSPTLFFPSSPPPTPLFFSLISCLFLCNVYYGFFRLASAGHFDPLSCTHQGLRWEEDCHRWKRLATWMSFSICSRLGNKRQLHWVRVQFGWRRVKRQENTQKKTDTVNDWLGFLDTSTCSLKRWRCFAHTTWHLSLYSKGACCHAMKKQTKIEGGK